MGPEQARGPKLCPVKNCLDGDGYLAPGRTATRALNRNQAQTNAHTNTPQAERDPSPRHRADTTHSEVEMRCLA